MTDPIDSTTNSNQLIISGEAATHLRESGSWGTFLAIVGFVFIGLFVLIGLFASTIFAQLGTSAGISSVAFTVVYLCLGALYFFPTLYLYRFSIRIKEALQKRDSILLTDALESLKSFWKFMGILTAVILGLYVLVFLGGILGGALF